MHVSLYLSKSTAIPSQNHLCCPIQGNSLYCLGPDNLIRITSHKVMHHYTFDWIILFFIVVTTVCLTLESPLLDRDDLII
jgi:hypothetical protein